jgi:hypothetical protein
MSLSRRIKALEQVHPIGGVWETHVSLINLPLYERGGGESCDLGHPDCRIVWRRPSSEPGRHIFLRQYIGEGRPSGGSRRTL